MSAPLVNGLPAVTFSPIVADLRFACDLCGAVVAFTQVHTDWHDDLATS